MSQLILIRHGNTFEAGELPRRVGARTDLPLTEKGEEQAYAAANRIAARHLPLSALIAGPLSRTRRFAEIIANQTEAVFTVDERLLEIDYGFWENQTDDEIRASYGPAALDAWDKDGVWPEDMAWVPSEEKVKKNVRSFLDEQRKLLETRSTKNRVAVTSNGILRFVHQSVTGEPPGQKAKVGTGCFCLLSPTENGWRIDEWNEKPL